MSLYTRVSAVWRELKDIYANINGTWRDADLYVRQSGVWHLITEKTYKYSPINTTKGSGWELYNSVGSVTNPSDPSPLHGAYISGDINTNRWAVIIFNWTQIQSDLAGRTIKSIRIKIKRLNTTHGVSSGANVHLVAHNLSSVPASMPRAQFGSEITESAETLLRGELKTVDVSDWFANALRDNTAKGIGLYVYSSTQSNYTKYDINEFELEIIA